jgi:hypothetical protein
MLDRRTFITSALTAAGTATLCGIAGAEHPNAHPSGVAGYNYRRPGLKKGSRLLFQGDSITDMGWGRAR